MCVVGTRPEAIKMAPIIIALKKEAWASISVLATTQHKEMLKQVLDLFDIKPDIDLDVMHTNQSLTSLTSRLLSKIDTVLLKEKPAMVLVQGDTTTVMSIALACFYHHIPVAHVEAGLRTGDILHPFPEEANRVIVSKIATLHFAPTQSARINLLKEGVKEQHISVTGNSVIDALLWVAEKDLKLKYEFDSHQRLILFTAHRRESYGEPLLDIYSALQTLALNNPEVQFLYPVHPNPNVHDVAHSMLNDIPNIYLCDPLDYGQFIAAMKRSYLIITDSGGVQEEAPALGKPVLVLRDKTERPEAVEQGVVKLVGSHCERIIQETQHLLDNETLYAAMAQKISPYGDGKTAVHIVKILKTFFLEQSKKQMSLLETL